MLDAFFSLVKESWQKTNGEKALIWRGYGLAWLVFSFFVFFPGLVLFFYFHFSFSLPTLDALSHTALLVTLLVIVSILGLLYSMFFFAAVPLLSLQYLRNEPLSAYLAVRRALVHKWPLFVNWFLFAVLYGFVHSFFKRVLLFDDVFIASLVFTILHLVLSLSILGILDRNEGALISFINGWQYFFKHIIFCLLTIFWIWLLSVFSLVTFFIGSIWAVPAQYNAIALLYEKVRAKD